MDYSLLVGVHHIPFEVNPSATLRSRARRRESSFLRTPNATAVGSAAFAPPLQSAVPPTVVSTVTDLDGDDGSEGGGAEPLPRGRLTDFARNFTGFMRLEGDDEGDDGPEAEELQAQLSDPDAPVFQVRHASGGLEGISSLGLS
jgi:hypothetical protein